MRASRAFNERTTDPSASANFFANFANMFAAGGAGGGGGQGQGQNADGQRPDAEGIFGDVFEEVSTSTSILSL